MCQNQSTKSTIVTHNRVMQYILNQCNLNELFVVCSLSLVIHYHLTTSCVGSCHPSNLSFIVEQQTVMVRIVWQLDLYLPKKSVPITTNIVSSNPTHGKVYLIQHYVIKFVSDLRQVCGFLWALRFPPPMKLTATI